MEELILKHFIDKEGKVAYLFPPYDVPKPIEVKIEIKPKEVKPKKSIKDLFK